MIAIDANILIYAFNSTAPEHGAAKRWLEETFSRVPAIGLPLTSILAFVRILTDRRLGATPLSTSVAGSIVTSWLTRENVFVLEPGARHWPTFFHLLEDASLCGARTQDAHLAALAIEHGATLYTNDRDFRLFPKLDVRFPLRDA